jgi:hypothetical protein
VLEKSGHKWESHIKRSVKVVERVWIWSMFTWLRMSICKVCGHRYEQSSKMSLSS